MLNIEISINVEILLLIIILTFTKHINLYLLFFFFVFIHEVCHMIVGVALGFKPKKLMIMPFGFKIMFQEIKTNNKIETKKIAVAAAGPIINILFGIVAIAFNLNKNIVYINLLIALFNLIPIFPLDGGRIIRSILNINLEKQKSYKVVNLISNITIVIVTALSSILVLYLKNINILFVTIYLWYVVIRENKKYKIIKRVFDVIEVKK